MPNGPTNITTKNKNTFSDGVLESSRAQRRIGIPQNHVLGVKFKANERELDHLDAVAIRKLLRIAKTSVWIA